MGIYEELVARGLIAQVTNEEEIPDIYKQEVVSIKVDKKGIADKFHFTGFLKGRNVYEMLAESDVYMMPSVSEPFGISPLEAMQMGVPSIISKQSGCAEILNNVIKTDYWDIDAMADAINSIVTYPAMYEQLREDGLNEVNQITWDKAGAKVIDIYRKVLSNYNF